MCACVCIGENASHHRYPYDSHTTHWFNEAGALYNVWTQSIAGKQEAGSANTCDALADRDTHAARRHMPAHVAAKHLLREVVASHVELVIRLRWDEVKEREGGGKHGSATNANQKKEQKQQRETKGKKEPFKGFHIL